MKRHTQSTDVPQAVVNGGETATMLGMGQLGQKHGRGDLGKRVAETKHDATTHESCELD